MRNRDAWAPGKYELHRGRLRGDRSGRHVGVGSRLMADNVAGFYADALPAYAAGRLVDLGCGDAPLYGIYRELATDVRCLDWPSTRHQARHVDAACDLSAGIPLSDGSADTVVLSDVLEHVRHPEPLVREIARVLAPGGVLLLNVPFQYGLHERPHDYFRFSEFALRDFVRGAGLELLELRALGGSLHVFADLLAKHLGQVPLCGEPLAAAVQALVRVLQAVPAVRRFESRSAEVFPYGYALVARRPGGQNGGDR